MRLRGLVGRTVRASANVTWHALQWLGQPNDWLALAQDLAGDAAEHPPLTFAFLASVVTLTVLRPRLRDLRKLLTLARAFRRLGSAAGEAVEILTGAARPVLDRWFESEELKATLATDAIIGWDQSQGALQSTGRDLDVGIQGEGWIAVQGTDGREAYTRAGDLRIDPNGLLMNGAGHYVLGDAGPLAVPPHSSVMIGADGTVSIVPIGQGPETTATVGRIKLVNPPAETLVRSEDGLFRTNDGADAPPDANVRLASGVLEASNVNVANAMVKMIELSRQFDLQVKAMRTAEENATSSAQLLRS